MKYLIPLLIILVVAGTGCTAVLQEIRSHQNPRGSVTTSDEPGIDFGCDLAFCSQSQATIEEFSISKSFRYIAPYLTVATAITTHRNATGEWATSWDEVLDCMPVLPCYPDSGELYNFADIDDYGDEYPADSVIASWDPSCPTIYFAILDNGEMLCRKLGPDYLEPFKEHAPQVADSTRKRGIEPETPSYQAMETLKAVTHFMIQCFELEHQRMPATKEELFEGFQLNPNYKLGYTVDENSDLGTFRLRIDPVGNYSRFIGITEPSGKLTTSYNHYRKPFEELNRDIYTAELDEDGYITILTEADFLS